MRTLFLIAVALVTWTSAQTIAGEAARGSGTETVSVLQRIAQLNKTEIMAVLMGVMEADKADDLLILFKYGDSTASAGILGKLGAGNRARLEAQIRELEPADSIRQAAAEQAIRSLLQPPALDIYRAWALQQSGDNRAAAEKYEQAFQAGGGNRDHYYNAACAWARAGDRDAAFRNLQKSFDAGLLLAKELQEDPDLDTLHSDARWSQLIGSMETKVAGLLSVLPDTHQVRAVVKLPAPIQDGPMSVEKALAGRRSVREYADAPLTLQQVAQVLWAAYGITQPIPKGPSSVRGGLRTAPSAGALYPLDIYLVAGNVTDLKPGIYKYRSETHELLLIVEGDKRPELYEASASQPWVKKAPASLVYSAIYARTAGKYGNRGRERYVCMDAGHSAENVYLECTALGLGTCALGAFLDANVRLVVNMTKPEEPVYIMPVGKQKERREK